MLSISSRPPHQRLWAPQTTRMQGTTWVQCQINSNSLIFEPPTCVAACAAKFWSPASKSHSKVFGKVGSSGCTNNTHIIMSALFSASPTLQKCTTRKKAQDSQCGVCNKLLEKVLPINDSLSAVS